MCRNIKKLRMEDRPPTDDEIKAAALQFVRKVSGYRVPSKANQAVFDKAIEEISANVRTLMDELTIR